jgi:hypothetical protein
MLCERCATELRARAVLGRTQRDFRLVECDECGSEDFLLAHGDDVFVIRGAGSGEATWRVLLGGKIVSAEWDNRGAAVAGLQVEQRREERRHGNYRTA